MVIFPQRNINDKDIEHIYLLTLCYATCNYKIICGQTQKQKKKNKSIIVIKRLLCDEAFHHQRQQQLYGIVTRFYFALNNLVFFFFDALYYLSTLLSSIKRVVIMNVNLYSLEALWLTLPPRFL
jgi:hypothetical protein